MGRLSVPLFDNLFDFLDLTPQTLASTSGMSALHLKAGMNRVEIDVC